MALKGTPEERRQQKVQRRRDNQVKHVRARAQRAQGHGLVVVACNAALAASKRATETGQQVLAKAIAELVERFEANNRKEPS